MTRGVSVQGSLSVGGDLCLGGSLSRWVSVLEVSVWGSVQGGLCPRGLCLCPGGHRSHDQGVSVSVQGVTGGLCEDPGDLCPWGSLSRGSLSRGSLSRGSLSGVSVLGVSVQGVPVQGSLSWGRGSLSGESLSRWVSVSGFSVWGSLSRRVSVQGVSVWGSVQGGLCPGVSVSVQGISVSVQGVSVWGVSVQGRPPEKDPPTVMSGRYASYWNAFLLRLHENPVVD